MKKYIIIFKYIFYYVFLLTERQVQPRQEEDTHLEQKQPSKKRKSGISHNRNTTAKLTD